MQITVTLFAHCSSLQLSNCILPVAKRGLFFAARTIMQASRTLARRSLFGLQRRNASEEAWMSRRWSEQTRAESGAVAVDDPPTSPLSPDHDIGDGVCDFANWFDKGTDVSTSQAVLGLGSALGFCYLIYRKAMSDAENSPPTFTIRENPSQANDIPSWDGNKELPLWKK